jgi:hypothetical protein
VRATSSRSCNGATPETINARDLISLLAKAGRLGYKDTNLGEYNGVDCLVQEANEGTLSAHSVSTLPGARIGQRSDLTASPHPSSVEASRGPKRRKTDEHGSLGVNGFPRTGAHTTPLAPAHLEEKGSNNV